MIRNLVAHAEGRKAAFRPQGSSEGRAGRSECSCPGLERSLHAGGAGRYSAGAGGASFTSLPLLSASSSDSSSEAPSMCSCRRPERLEEKVMGPPLLRTREQRGVRLLHSPNSPEHRRAWAGLGGS